MRRPRAAARGTARCRLRARGDNSTRRASRGEESCRAPLKSPAAFMATRREDHEQGAPSSLRGAGGGERAQERVQKVRPARTMRRNGAGRRSGSRRGVGKAAPSLPGTARARAKAPGAAPPPCPGTEHCESAFGRKCPAIVRALRGCSAIAVDDMASARPATAAPRSLAEGRDRQRAEGERGEKELPAPKPNMSRRRAKA